MEYWSLFCQQGWHKDFSAIVYRHLYFKRTEEFEKNLSEFAYNVKGRKYKFSLMKCLMSKYWTNTNKEEDNSNREFFCSELVASAYITLGLLSNQISPSQYFPVHFSKEKQLDFVNSAYLGNEYLIDI